MIEIGYRSQKCPGGGMVDTRDLKSLGPRSVRVQVPPRAPTLPLKRVRSYRVQYLRTRSSSRIHLEVPPRAPTLPLKRVRSYRVQYLRTRSSSRIHLEVPPRAPTLPLKRVRSYRVQYLRTHFIFDFKYKHSILLNIIRKYS
jgi:hypothetical protein